MLASSNGQDLRFSSVQSGFDSSLCINNYVNYKRIYDQLIEHRQKNVLTTGYIERHHIVPSSLGGTDESSNIVALTGREHYIAHLLLARFNRCSQTVYALWIMQMKSSKNCDRPCIKSGRMYEWTRKEFAKYMSKNAKILSKGERNSQHGTCWICNPELKENKKIKNGESIPSGWLLGRNKWNFIERLKLDKRINITDGKNNKRLYYADQIIPEGWYEGTVSILTEKGKKSISKAVSLSNKKRRGIQYNKCQL